MLTAQEKQIGPYRVRSEALPAMRAYALVPRIAKLVGPMLSQAATQGASVNILAAILDAFGLMEPGEATSLMLALLAMTSINDNGKTYQLNSEPAINALFTGKVLLLVQVQQFALEVNFADFFAAASGLAEATPTPAEPQAAP
jgi:Phage tail assembly chaperone protein, TAC